MKKAAMLDGIEGMDAANYALFHRIEHLLEGKARLHQKTTTILYTLMEV